MWNSGEKVSQIKVAVWDFPSIPAVLPLSPDVFLPGAQWLRYHLDGLQSSWGAKVELLTGLLESGWVGSCIPIPGTTAFHMH